MNEHLKKGFRWWLFNKIGPEEVRNLVHYIDTHTQDGQIVLYPLGEYMFNVRTSKGDDMEPMVFPTIQERNAFQHGLSYGVNLMGGTTAQLTEEDIQTIDMMRKASTHSNGGNQNH